MEKADILEMAVKHLKALKETVNGEFDEESLFPDFIQMKKEMNEASRFYHHHNQKVFFFFRILKTTSFSPLS